MILSDGLIRERLADRSLGIEPYDDRCVQPSSYDLTLGDALHVWPRYVIRDPGIDQSAIWQPVPLDECWVTDSDGNGRATRGWLLRPELSYLATTAEEIRLPADVCGQLVARSTWGRLFLSVICGPAGYLDAGYRGRPTLELFVIGAPLLVTPGAACLQIVLHQMAAPACRPYGHKDRTSRYFGDWMPTPARMEAR